MSIARRITKGCVKNPFNDGLLLRLRFKFMIPVSFMFINTPTLQKILILLQTLKEKQIYNGWALSFIIKIIQLCWFDGDR